MHMDEIRQLARARGLPGKRNKVELVRSIQQDEGNFTCFATAYDGICDQTGCRWRADCFSLAQRGRQA